MTQIFLILILTILAGYFNIPKFYFIILVFILSFAVNRYINSDYKLNIIKLIQKLGYYIIIVAPFAFCLYLLDIPILNTIYCEDSDLEENQDGNSDKKDKGKKVAKDSSFSEPNESNGQGLNILDQGIKAINRASDVLDKAVDTFEGVANKSLDLVEKAMDKTSNYVKDNAPYAALAAIGGSSANKAMELVANKGPKIMVSTGIVATTGVMLAAGGTIEILKNISKNNQSIEELDKSKEESSDLNQPKDDEDNGPDSPSETGGGFISSPFEKEIPLVSILDNLFILNYVELGLMFSILFIILRLYLNPKLKILILKILNYFIKNKDELYNKEMKINYIFDNFTKYSPYAIVFLFLILISIKVINLYFMFYLSENIDSFVKVYNHLTKNSFYLFLSNWKMFKFKKQDKKFSKLPPIFGLKQGICSRKYSTISYSSRLNNVRIPFSNNRNISTINNPKLPISSISYDLDSPIFGKLLSLLSTNSYNDELQIQIEQLLQNQALEIDKFKLSKEGNSTHESHINKAIIIKLKELKPTLEKIINNYKTNLLIMDSNLSSLDSIIIYNMSTEFLINIMYGRLINIISNNQLLNNKTYQVEVTIDLGKEVVNKYTTGIYKKIKQSNRNITYIQWKEENQEFINQTTESQLRFEVGNLLINFMTDLKLIKTEVKVLARDEKKSILVVGPALVKLIPKLKTSYSIQAIPNRIPMICPPKLYKVINNKYLELGGYLLNGEEYTDEIILSNWELSSKSALLGENDITDMVNKINSVAFKINENVLDFILLNNNKYGFFTDTNCVNPLSLKQKLTMIEQRELASVNSRKHLELNILGLATIFRNVPSIYLPVRIDYRGRLYCVTEYLNYQGLELSKGLLEFSFGEKVYLTDQAAINYLKIFGANCFGNKLDKKSFLDRVAWIDNNLEDIINFDNGILLKKAENKTLFLSFCFEYKKYIQALNNNNPFFVSNLPIQLDASCNGFQHLTLLIDDLAMAKELNLNESNWNDNPKDFYSFIALKIKKYFVDKLEEYRVSKLNLSAEDKESYEKLAELDIFRGLIKKAVMTIPYNASASSIIEYLKDNFDKKKNLKFTESDLNKTVTHKEDKYKDFYIYVMKSELSKKEKIIFKELDFKNLKKALNFSIFVDYPKLTALAEYLKGVAKVSNKLKIPIPWILPSGLIINQQFYGKETLKIKPFLYTKNLLNLTVLNKNQFNNNKQKIALMPNLIHSLDAASLCLVIVNYFKQVDNINFYSIHDCFAVPCNKVNNLFGLLKTAYCIIYSDSKYLLDFDNYFRSTIISSYGEEAVSFKDEEGKIIVILNNETISIKFPSINSVIDNKNSKINLKNSNYLIH